MYDMGERRRLALRFVGDVQGVGFRWNSRRIAEGLGCTGWVRNECDGSVTMELQGSEDQVSQFFGSLHALYKDWHVSYAIDSSEDIPVRAEERSFQVRHV